MAYVLVDADALARVRHDYKQMSTQTAIGDYAKQVLREVYEQLAPIVPELPEGATCFQSDVYTVAVSWREPCGDYCVASIDVCGLSSHVVGGASVACQIPNDVAAYLLARWQSLQGGA
jgi:hypothetical protein